MKREAHPKQPNHVIVFPDFEKRKETAQSERSEVRL